MEEHLVQGARGESLCRTCMRKEDEALLAPISPEEQHGLDMLADILDSVPWDFWKPGEQPAKLLDWLYLGDLEEAMNFELLERKGITAVVNLINWWELTARLPEVGDISSVYEAHKVDFLEADSEDRLFFDIIDKSWPEAEVFMEHCRKRNKSVLVNCKAGHNRSACICVCWLISREGMTLTEAVQWVLERRGMILSNHGFRLQLVRLALKLGRLGDRRESSVLPSRTNSFPEDESKPSDGRPLKQIIAKKRLSLKYDHNSRDYTCSRAAAKASAAVANRKSLRGSTFLTQDVTEHLAQRTIKMELLACLYHRGRGFLSEYDYTSNPPTIIGSGFSGDVVLCQMRDQGAVVRQNCETGVRCVKRFDLTKMAPDRLDKLKNEALIYLSLEHPHIARLFDVFEDKHEVALVMQYCSGGTLEDSLKSRGTYSLPEFKRVGVQMLLAMTYIHQMGIVHRDIKPRNWVYEADGATVKLIDFGFSAKAYLSEPGGKTSGKLLGCMGTLGYLAPEVVKSTNLSSDSEYNERCDIWSLGAVFYELLVGQPAFHRDRGQCDGYTEEVVLREIEGVTEDGIRELLETLPEESRPFISRLLTPDPDVRPSAREVLEDSFLATARRMLLNPSDSLSMSTVLDRFRAHGRLSKTSRAWLLAVARSPTYLPWKDFCQLRNTFKVFDARGLIGTINLDIFMSTVVDGLGLDGEEALQALEEEVSNVWASVCGKQESLSYCEFLAALLPPIEDVFEDVETKDGQTPSLTAVKSYEAMDFFDGSPRRVGTPAWSPSPHNDCIGPFQAAQAWNLSEPVASYIPLLRGRKRGWRVPVFDEDVSVQHVVHEMMNNRLRWAVISFFDGQKEFFDYMDLNFRIVSALRKGGGVASEASKAAEAMLDMPVGKVANCSGWCSWAPRSPETSLREVLRLIVDTSKSPETGGGVRRVPIVSPAGEVLHVFSCSDFLDLAVRFPGPSAVLKQQSARTFDKRSTILQSSVMMSDPVTTCLDIMHSCHITVVPATLRELSGDLGGVAASNVISASDLKHVIVERRPDVLQLPVDQFITWRQGVLDNVDDLLRRQRLHRFNVVSVDAGDSLYSLACRLLASKLQRIFLSSDEIARIVGIVSSRDILIDTLDHLV